MGVNTLIQFRKGSDWTSDPILASGEPGFDTANNILKIGDGSKTWSELSPIGAGTSTGSGTNVSVTGSAVLDDINITGVGNIVVTLGLDNLLSISGIDGFSFRGYEDVTTTKTIFDIGQNYNSGELNVYYNGLKLLINEDYSADGGTTFTLVENAVSGDIIEWVGGYTGSSFFQDIGGSGTANYITKWSDKNTITSGTIYDDGKVGIGTSSPSFLLDVNGSGNIKYLRINNQFTFPTGDGSANQIITTNGNGVLSWSDISESTDGTLRIIKSEGFQVGGADIATLDFSSDFDISENPDQEINIALANSYVSGTGFSGYLAFWSDSDSLSYDNQLYWDNTNSYLGIGTINPSYKLEIDGDIGLTNQGFYTSSSGTIIGTSGWIYQSGQQVLSNGGFGINIGDSQASQNILRGITTNNTFTNLECNGLYSGILLASNRTMGYTVTVVGRETSSSGNASYKLEGLLANDRYGVRLLGDSVKTTFYESNNSWDAQVSVTGCGYNCTDYLLVQCKGSSNSTINWVAKVELIEVGGLFGEYDEVNMLVNSDLTP